MADLSITAITVVDPATLITDRTASEAFAIGQPMYVSTAQYALADATDTNKLAVKGISITSGSSGDYPILAGNGSRLELTGPTLTKGQAYVLSGSGTAGKIAPFADLGTSDSVVELFVAETTSIVQVRIYVPNPAITL